MPIITLTTDFGLKDPSVASVKGAIFSDLSEGVRVVDISHEISPFNLTEAAYIINKAHRSFPQGSIHIIGVDAELSPENKHLALKINGHYFLAADNGVMSLLTETVNADKIVEINIHDNYSDQSSALDIFVKVASHISRGGELGVIGKERQQIKTLRSVRPVLEKEQAKLIGHVFYIDNYGNVVTNITKKVFKDFGKGRLFTIQARSVKFREVFETYSAAINFDKPQSERMDSGKKIALFNSSGFLELAIYKSNPETVGSASSLFGLAALDSVTVNFE